MRIETANEELNHKKRWLLTGLFLLGIVLPIAGTTGLQEVFQNWTFNSLPLHSTFEVLGAGFGLILATLILLKREDNASSRQMFLACALIGMAVLDIFHSCVPTGVSFVWLHSIAVLAGGIFFTLFLLPDIKITRKLSFSVAIAVFMGSVLIGALSTAFPDSLPAMVIDGKFTFTANFINFTGGGLTILGAVGFALSYYVKMQKEDLLFLVLCLLFGTAGIIFQWSHLWESGWWFWHLLRFLAYTLCWIALFFFRNKEDADFDNWVTMINDMAESDNVGSISDEEQDKIPDKLKGIFFNLRENLLRLQNEDKIKTGIAELNDIMRGEKKVTRLCDDIISYICKYLEAQVGTIFILANDDTKLELKGKYAFKSTKRHNNIIALGEGLLGQAALDKKPIVVHEVTEDDLKVVSGLGETVPENIICFPFLYEDNVKGVIEIGSIHKFTDKELNFLKQVDESIAVAVNSAQQRDKTQELLEKTK